MKNIALSLPGQGQKKKESTQARRVRRLSFLYLTPSLLGVMTFFVVPFAPVSVQLSVLPMKKPLTHRAGARIVSSIIMYLKLICSSFSGFELKLKFSIWMHRYLLYCLAPERIGIVRPLFSS